MSGQFKAGDNVTVRSAHSLGHVRTPHYVKGKRGVIERVCGDFANPEELAYDRDGLPNRALYRVRFQQHEMWADYGGPTDDTVDVELYDHWLEPANAED